MTESRALHLIDIENLCRSSLPSASEVEAAHVAYARLVGPGDHVIVACSHKALATVGWGWPHARILLGSGRNGADQRLIEVIRNEAVEDRFGRVFVGSGDGVFVEDVARLGSVGVDVTVVAPLCSLAKRLRLAARSVVPFRPRHGQAVPARLSGEAS